MSEQGPVRTAWRSGLGSRVHCEASCRNADCGQDASPILCVLRSGNGAEKWCALERESKTETNRHMFEQMRAEKWAAAENEGASERAAATASPDLWRSAVAKQSGPTSIHAHEAVCSFLPGDLHEVLIVWRCC